MMTQGTPSLMIIQYPYNGVPGRREDFILGDITSVPGQSQRQLGSLVGLVSCENKHNVRPSIKIEMYRLNPHRRSNYTPLQCVGQHG